MKFSCSHCGGITEVGVIESEYVGCGHCEEVVEVPKNRFDKGAVIAGDFVILEQIGIGGMGLVFKAHQISLERIVALKILKDSFSQDEKFINGFITEARSAAKLRHSNIVQAYAVGYDEGVFYIALEHVEGPTTAQMLLQNHRFSEKEVLKISIEISEALEHGWEKSQLLHRDIKPDNIMIDKAGNAKLMDLGLACPYNESLNEDEDEVLGTPQYISPEQLTGQLMDFRGDHYSLGATLYHLLTNEFPFNGEDASQTAMMHLNDPLTPPNQTKKNISEKFSNVICKMMAKSPDDRYRTSQELIHDLKACYAQLSGSKRKVRLDGKPTRTRSRRKESAKPKSTPDRAHKQSVPHQNLLKYGTIAIVGLFVIIALVKSV
ncbi:MAG: protein kinase [Lentisphaeraceae bacterium]|nr:protein kinase [Lentisphaeraceae bacterium]